MGYVALFSSTNRDEPIPPAQVERAAAYFLAPPLPTTIPDRDQLVIDQYEDGEWL